MTYPELSCETMLQPLLDATRAASARIMQDWQVEKTITYKTDGSPVTTTDAAAEAIITSAIRKLGAYQIVAEEEFEQGTTGIIDATQPFFLVDALDGTRDFIKHGSDFTVNIALMQNCQPVLGIICAPVTGHLWYAIQGQGTYTLKHGEKQGVSMRARPAEGITLLGGKRSSEPEFLEPFIGAHEVAGRSQRSSSLKFCMLVDGEADLYPRLGATSEWDTAAGDIILREGGGVVLDIKTGAPLTYGKQAQRFLNPGFIAGNRDILKATTL